VTSRRARIIAIDGPSGVGKGTVARAIARELRCRHVDTGAMYRAIGWRAIQLGVPLDNEAEVAQVARDATFDLSAGRVLVDGHDVTTAIRTPEMDRAATAVARLPAVRAVLVARQRAMAAGGTLVMEGRDIGTVVFPDADVKVYLDASPEERARRRASDPAHTGRTGGIASVAQEMEARDQNDRTRLTSPLTMAPDAVLVDTTGVPLDEVVRRVLELVVKKTGVLL
jgi:cytidylate kinase